MKKKIVAAFCLAMVMTVGGCSGTGTAAQPESSGSQTAGICCGAFEQF